MNEFKNLQKMSVNEFEWIDNQLITKNIWDIGYKCRKNIGKYKIFIKKTWNGNYMGNTSTAIIVDTKTGDIRYCRLMYGDYTRLIDMLDQDQI